MARINGYTTWIRLSNHKNSAKSIGNSKQIQSQDQLRYAVVEAYRRSLLSDYDA